MITFIISILLIGAFLMITLAIHMKIRPRHTEKRQEQYYPHLHDVIFTREMSEEGWLVVTQ